MTIFSGTTLFIFGMAIAIEAWSGNQDLTTLYGIGRIIVGAIGIVMAKEGIMRLER